MGDPMGRGTKPNDLAEPVPNADAARLAAQYMANYKAPKAPIVDQSAQGSPDAAASAAQYAKSVGLTPPDDPSAQANPDINALQMAGRVLDYPGGLVRTAAAGAMGAAGPEDFKAAAQGKAPSSAEYLKRLGVSEGGSMQLPFLGKVTQRGAEGLALDIASDPLTVIARTVREIPYLKNLLNGPGAAADAIGEAVYKSALPKKAQGAADAIMEGVPSEIAGVKGPGVAGAPIGGTEKLAEKVQNMSQAIGGLRQGLYDKVNSLGAQVDFTKEGFDRTFKILNKYSSDPNLAPLLEDLTDFSNNYLKMGQVPIETVSQWKTNLYNALPASAWQGGGMKLKGVAKEFKAALALDFRDAIVNTGNRAEKGLGTAIDDLNNKWGSLLDAKGPMDRAAESAGSGSRLGEMIDGAVLASGGLKAAAVKKSYDIATSPFMKTLVGNALMEAGKNGLATGAVNRYLIEKARKERESAE